MPTAIVRYGRPKGSGLDDRQQLRTIAALLAANPKLKPTTAIRSLGVDNPSAIRRLRDKFRLEQDKLLADARRSARPRATRSIPVTSNENTPLPERAGTRALVPIPRTAKPTAKLTPANALVVGWCDLAFAMLSAATEAHAVLAEHWLRLPPVAATLRRQLALNTMAVAIYTRGRSRRRILH